MSVIVKKPTEKEFKEAQDWPEWCREVSDFDWSYEEQETCYILAGSATVSTADGVSVSFTVGDWVIFPKGLNCHWEISEAIRKKYKFGN